METEAFQKKEVYILNNIIFTFIFRKLMLKNLKI
jgi:hypothetical protein